MWGSPQLWGRSAPEDERRRLGRDRETPRWMSGQGSGNMRQVAGSGRVTPRLEAAKPGTVATAPPARQTPCSRPMTQLDACDPHPRGRCGGPSSQGQWGSYSPGVSFAFMGREG